MSTDYFACGAYGVLLDDSDMGENIFFARFMGLIEQELANWQDADEDEDEDEDEDSRERPQSAGDRVLKQNPDLLEELQAALQAPADTTMLWTGDPDERPGRSATPPDCWVLGYGMYGLPLDKGVPEAFRNVAGMYTWVTSG